MTTFYNLFIVFFIGAVFPALAIPNYNKYFVRLKTTDWSDEQIQKQVATWRGNGPHVIIRIPGKFLAYSAELKAPDAGNLKRHKTVHTLPFPLTLSGFANLVIGPRPV